MNHVLFVNELNNTFKSFDVNDCIIKNDSLILPIDKEKDFPNYKILFSFKQKDDAEASSFFYLKEVNNDIFKMINDFNGESFLKFSIEEDVLKISYPFIGLKQDDFNYVCEVLTLIPTVIHEFSDDLLRIIK